MVGHITALADCQWSKQGSGVRGPGSGISKTQDLRPKTVYLGDRFAVASGLMEITYDTGAKVILEGPCTYEIDSVRGGYLAIGRLTAKVEKNAEGGRRRAENTNPQSLIPNPLFAVRTPTAIVTDLGTEFGVEVEESGATRSHVFQGSVELRSSNSRRLTTSGESVEILRVGESARVERGRNNKVVISRVPGRPDHFVRQINKSPNGQISKFHPLFPGPRSLIPRYHLTDLGTLGGRTSRANAINALGQVVGEAATVNGATHAFLYADGTMKDLGTLHGGNSCAKDINALGQVVGWSTSGKADYRAFFHEADKMRDLGTLGGTSAYAYAVNDAGVVVGASVNSGGVMRAFIKTRKDGMKDLGALGGPNVYSCAFDVNATGQVVGISEISNGSGHAYLYTSGVGMKDLSKIVGDHSTAFGINDVGTLVGVRKVGNLCHGFVCDANMKHKSLGVFGGAKGCAFKINNSGQIVGIVDRGSSRAFLYRGGNKYDLTSLVERSDGWTITGATGINDSGQIAGFGRAPDGKLRAVLLTPVKENNP